MLNDDASNAVVRASRRERSTRHNIHVEAIEMTHKNGNATTALASNTSERSCSEPGASNIMGLIIAAPKPGRASRPHTVDAAIGQPGERGAGV